VNTLAFDSDAIGQWLPWALALAVALMVGVIAGLFLRGPMVNGDSRSGVDESMLKEIEGVRLQIEDVRIRVAELIGAAQRASSHLDDRTARLQELVEMLDRRLALLQSAAPYVTRSLPGFQTPPASEPVAEKPRYRDSQPDEPSSAEPLTVTVYRLADAGRPPADIARELNENVGKVELILALRSM